jgi:hypothetical protein
VVVAARDVALAECISALAYGRRFPWCPLVLVSAEPLEPEELAGLDPGGPRLVQMAGEEVPRPAHARAMVRENCQAAAVDLRGYLVRRTRAVVERWQRSAWLDGAAPVTDPLWLEVPAWSAEDVARLERCIRAMLRTVQALRRPSWLPGPRGEDADRLAPWCRRYFGPAWRTLLTFDVWEAFAEAAWRWGGTGPARGMGGADGACPWIRPRASLSRHEMKPLLATPEGSEQSTVDWRSGTCSSDGVYGKLGRFNYSCVPLCVYAQV